MFFSLIDLCSKKKLLNTYNQKWSSKFEGSQNDFCQSKIKQISAKIKVSPWTSTLSFSSGFSICKSSWCKRDGSMHARIRVVSGVKLRNSHPERWRQTLRYTGLRHGWSQKEQFIPLKRTWIYRQCHCHVKIYQLKTQNCNRSVLS